MVNTHQISRAGLSGIVSILISSWVMFIGCLAFGESEHNPMNYAVFLCTMNEAKDLAGKGCDLHSEGDVKLGIALEGAEREASLLRGGDGKAAEFQGGYLSANQGADGELNLTGKAMTMYIRLRLGSDMKDTPLFSKHGGGKALVYNLFCTELEAGAGPSFGFELGTDAKEQPLRVSVPLSILGADAWRDIIVRFSGAKLELFVDGVLVDEEWPMGSLRQGNTAPCLIGAEQIGDQVKSGFHGWIDHAALWDRALMDDEIAFLSGGKEIIEKRKIEILGVPAASMQYWSPPGYNANVGDCMPFFHDGRFHVFYLFDRRHHASKWGLGAHQWAHVSTTDLVNWEQHPMAIPITEQWEGSICTGSVFFHDGIYYAHYAVRMPDGKQHLAQAISKDGIHFEKQKPFPLASPQEGYDPFHYRDPLVFEDKAASLFRMLVTARFTDQRDGCLAQLISKDLKTWTLAEPFINPGRVTDCPDYFEWDGWHYLLAEFVYWNSKEPLGPWNNPKPNKLDVLYVPKTAEFTGNRRIYVSWLPGTGWGGNMVFRELIQHEDGTLGTKFLPEMIPALGYPGLRVIGESTPGAFVSGNAYVLEASSELQTMMLPNVKQDVRITMRVIPTQYKAKFGVIVRCAEGNKKGCELRFEPANQKVQFGIAENGEVAKKAVCEIDSVEGLDKPFFVEIIVKKDIVDVCIDNRRTMITRYQGKDKNVCLFAQGEGGQVAFENVEICPIVE